MSYVTSRLQGRTGNMMFQLANGYSKSLEYNKDFFAPYGESSSKPHEKTLFRNINFTFFKTNEIIDPKIIMSPFHFTDLEDPDEHKPTIYIGWFQSEKFFKKYKNEIINLFSPTDEFINQVYNDFPVLKDSIVGSINVRRGDYLTQSLNHPVITIDYINKAYEQLPKCDYIVVVSDDIEWCKENIKLPNVLFIEKYYDGEALWFLSLCDHFIISNSSFSWWGAYLSKKENKKVISPSIWVGPGIVDNMEDIWCDDWVKIPCEYNDGKIILK